MTIGAFALIRELGAVLNHAVGFDVTRLFLGPLSQRPRGIDRVEMEYARWFLERYRGDVFGVLPTPWGIRCFDRARTLRAVNSLDELWGEDSSAHDDSAFRALLAALSPASSDASFTTEPTLSTDSVARKMSRQLTLISSAGFSFGRSAKTMLPRNSFFVSVGHLGLASSVFLNWLRERSDIRTVFMLHDTIPLESPNFVSSGARSFHSTLIRNAATFARGVIVPSNAARRSVEVALDGHGRNDIPITAIHLPPPRLFTTPVLATEPVVHGDFFLVCGTIEPRKNHALLFNVWRELAATLGTNVPKLVVAGAQGFMSKQIRSGLQMMHDVSPYVVFSSGLTSPAVKILTARARAVLMPSFAEGFGLPVVEALAMGTPVLASNLEVHREIAGSRARLLCPHEPESWTRAILDIMDEPRKPCAPQKRVDDDNWDRYFEKVRTFMSDMADHLSPALT